MKVKSLLISIVLLSFLMPLGIKAQTQSCKVLQDNFSTLQVEFTLGKVSATTSIIDNQRFTSLIVDGLLPSEHVGLPNLPTFSKLIETPLRYNYRIEITESEFDTVDAADLGVVYPIAPLQPSYSKSDTGRHALVINEQAYGQDAFIGESLTKFETVGIARDRNLARFQISPLQYNARQNRLIVCRHAIITIHYSDVDIQGSQEWFNRYNSPAFNSGSQTINSLYSVTGSNLPIRYLIVAHNSFRGQLDSFITWKKRKGFITDIAYTDGTVIDSTNTSIQDYLQSQYYSATASNPAPTYLLLVGDVEQIPAFSGNTSSHVTDLYYATLSDNDNIPDCYYGRFSAQNLSQLTPQIEKTLMYEQYTFEDPSFLDRAVMVAGVDGGSSGDYGYTHADPAMDYAITNYINGDHGFTSVHYFKNNTSIVPTATNVTVGSNSSSNAATVRSYYNEGAGWCNYSAHGSSSGWYMPGLSTTNVNSMTNSQKFGVMIGNCCQTSMFGETTCFAEALLRKGNYCGAVGYIGGSDYTYWFEDFYWAVGLRNSIGPTMSMAYDGSNLGSYDRLNHTHGEDTSVWVATQGGIMMAGNMAVQSSTSSRRLYYWEIYHLMGDPSVMPYLTQASTMTLTAPSTILVTASTITVQAVPYAYVALTDTATHTLVASAFANSTGVATLTLPMPMAIGTYEIAASAQQYQIAFQTVSVVPANGPYVTITPNTSGVSFTSGTTVWLPLTVANIGSQNANGVVVRISSNHPNIHISQDSIAIGTVNANDTLPNNPLLSITIDSGLYDGAPAMLTFTTTWNGCTYPISVSQTVNVAAPKIEFVYVHTPENIIPGNHDTVSITFTNRGHAPFVGGHMALAFNNCTSVNVTAMNETEFVLMPDSSITRQFVVSPSASTPEAAYAFCARAYNDVYSFTLTSSIYIGSLVIEDFESGNFNIPGWVQGDYPWAIVSTEHAEGSYCARSNPSLSHNQTSSLTITLENLQDDSVSFYYKVSSEANYDKFHFYLDGTEMVTNSGIVDWTRVTFFVPAGHHTYTFNYAKDGTVSSNSDCAWIDKIKFPPSSIIPTCFPPQVSVRDISDNNVTLSWQPGNDEDHWSVAYREASDTTYTLYQASVTSTTITIYGLNPMTSYYFIVSSLCTDESAASTPILATTTAVPAQLPYFCDFENSQDNGWQLVNGTQINKWYIGSATSNGGSNSLYISNNNGASNTYTITTTSNVFAVRPVYIPVAGEYEYSYDWHCYGESSWDYLNAALAPSSMTFTAGNICGFGLGNAPSGTIRLYPNSNTMNQTSSWTTVTGTINVTAPGTYNIVFLWHNDASQGTMPPAAIDNFLIRRFVSCEAPDNLTVTQSDGTSVTIEWAAPLGAIGGTSYEVSNGISTAIVNGTSYTFTSLAPNSQYRLSVRAICGDGDTSDAVSTILTTGCFTINSFPYIENFDGYTSSTEPKTDVEPTCWELVHQYVTITNEYRPMVYYAPENAHSDNYSLLINKRGIYAMPEVSLPVNTLQMSMYLKQGRTKYQLVVGVMSDKEDPTTFVPVQTINNSTTEIELVTVDFSGYTGNGRFIAFKNILASGSTGDFSCNYIDDLVLDVIPTATCSPITSFPYTENFDGYTSNTAAKTGVEPNCWELVHEYVSIANEYRPMIYYSSANAHSGNYSLILNKRGIYAMPEVGVPVNTLQLSMWLKQGMAKYQLVVGVLSDKDDYTTFVPVQTINNSSTNSEQVVVNFSDYAGNGRYIAFKNILASGYSGEFSCNYIDDLVLDVIPTVTCSPITTFPYVENFDSITTITAAKTGIEPSCWELVHQVVPMTSEYKPMVYYAPENAHSGNYSLLLNKLGIYAMPEVGVDVSTLQLSMYLKQGKAKYQLVVGVMSDKDDPTTFVPVQTINNSTFNSQLVTVDFSSYSGNGHYIAFKNILASGYTGEFSCNYIDDLTLSVAPASSKDDEIIDVDVNFSDIAVYPNPTAGKITVEGADIQRIEVYDNCGRRVAEYRNGGDIDLSGFVSGIYNLRIITDDGVAVKKVVKK